MLRLGLSGEHTDLLMAQMQAVLPRVDLIAVRERRTAPALLRSLGARSDRVFVTGDDAITLAFQRHPTKLGGALGINLRVMRSAEVDESMIDRLRPILHAFAREHATSLVPGPGAHGNRQPDSCTLRALLAGWDDEADGGSGLSTPVQVMDQAGRCVHARSCGDAVALEHNGDLYSCDHYVEPGYLLGNIAEGRTMLELVNLPQQKAFGQAKLDTLPEYCRSCDVRFACSESFGCHGFRRGGGGREGLITIIRPRGPPVEVTRRLRGPEAPRLDGGIARLIQNSRRFSDFGV
jgi:radical SAM protein with 4Fe4S-binding SPASM domain